MRSRVELEFIRGPPRYRMIETGCVLVFSMISNRYPKANKSLFGKVIRALPELDYLQRINARALQHTDWHDLMEPRSFGYILECDFENI